MKNLWRLLGYLKPYLASLVLASLLLAVSGALMGVVVAIMDPLVKEVLLQESPETEAGEERTDVFSQARKWLALDRVTGWAKNRALVQVPLLLVIVFFIRAVFLYFGQYLTTRAGIKVIRDLRVDLFDAVVKQSLKFFQAHPTGMIMSRIMNDVLRLQKVSTTVLADLVRVGVGVPFLVFVILWYDWRMSLFASLVLPAMAYPMIRLGRRLRKASTRSQESMADVSSVLNESISGVKVVQGFGMEAFESGRFRNALQGMLRADLKAGRAAALAPSVMEIVGAVAGAALFVFAGYQIAAGRLDPGRFTVVLAGLGYLFASLRRLNTLNVEIQQGLVAAQRVFDFIDREREIRDAPGARALPGFTGEIRFDEVNFAYEDDRVLHGIDLGLRKGEVVALVGASGSGKSTLANLVPRFFDPTSGSISIDGHDLREITLESLRGAIGLVTQETVLFDDTVRNNIAYGMEDVPLERVAEVARAAYAHDFIENLPAGYDTRLGEKGARLSMGQRQRLTIARALLKDPPILILDEATSALDSESEAEVQKALEVLMEGRTSIIIAHRLATVRRADRIVVLEAGRIVEEGTHGELLKRGGTYAHLHELQFREPEEVAGSR